MINLGKMALDLLIKEKVKPFLQGDLLIIPINTKINSRVMLAQHIILNSRAYNTAETTQDFYPKTMKFTLTPNTSRLKTIANHASCNLMSKILLSQGLREMVTKVAEEAINEELPHIVYKGFIKEIDIILQETVQESHNEIISNIENFQIEQIAYSYLDIISEEIALEAIDDTISLYIHAKYYEQVISDTCNQLASDAMVLVYSEEKQYTRLRQVLAEDLIQSIIYQENLEELVQDVYEEQVRNFEEGKVDLELDDILKKLANEFVEKEVIRQAQITAKTTYQQLQQQESYINNQIAQEIFDGLLTILIKEIDLNEQKNPPRPRILRLNSLIYHNICDGILRQLIEIVIDELPPESIVEEVISGQAVLQKGMQQIIQRNLQNEKLTQLIYQTILNQFTSEQWLKNLADSLLIQSKTYLNDLDLTNIHNLTPGIHSPAEYSISESYLSEDAGDQLENLIFTVNQFAIQEMNIEPLGIFEGQVENFLNQYMPLIPNSVQSFLMPYEELKEHSEKCFNTQ